MDKFKIWISNWKWTNLFKQISK